VKFCIAGTALMPASQYLTLTPNSPILAGPDFAAKEDAFYTAIRTSNRIFKMTAHRRLDAMNDLLFEILDRRSLSGRTLMDIGIASGITTLEWLNAFEERGETVDMIATDLTINVYLANLGRHLRALLEPNGHILQIEVMGRGIGLWNQRHDVRTGRFIWKKALLALVRACLWWSGASPGDDRRRGRSGSPSISGPYQLVTPRLRSHVRVRLLDDDILAATPPDRVAVADVIRLANIVQRSYFTEEHIRKIVRNVRERCRGPGSLVVLCRNRSDGFEGSILRLTDDGKFAVEARLDSGSEAERFFTEV
jgi:hypothetical protein